MRPRSRGLGSSGSPLHPLSVKIRSIIPIREIDLHLTSVLLHPRVSAAALRRRCRDEFLRPSPPVPESKMTSAVAGSCSSASMAVGAT